MRGYSLQKRKKIGRSVFSISLLISALFWIASLFFSTPPLPESNYLANIFQAIPFELSKGIALLSYLTIGYLIIPLNNTFGLIQIKASLQTSIFFFFISACPSLHLLQKATLLPFFFLGSIYTLFTSYQLKESSSNLFRSALYIGIASLLLPQLIFILPIIISITIILQTLNWRSFFALLLGYVTPYWFLFTFAFTIQRMDYFYKPIQEIFKWYPSITNINLSINTILTTLYVFILFMVSSTYFVINRHRNKLRTRAFLGAIITITFSLFVFILIQPIHIGSLFPCLLIGNSILVAHLFALTKGKLANVFFIFSAIGLFIIFVFNLWTH